MKISEQLNTNNLHHAYLIEGPKEEIFPQVLDFLKTLGVRTMDNPDFSQIIQDSFKINDARNLKLKSIERGISSSKKVFIIAVNNFLIEAQNTLLKMFEEPTANTVFFLIIPNIAVMMPTLLSRFYLIKTKNDLKDQIKEAENFLSLSLDKRILFVKDLIAKKDANEEEDFDSISLEFNRSKAIKFLNALETFLHRRLISQNNFNENADYFYQILKARQFINQPGSSLKSLMESVAFTIPRNSK